MSPKQKLKAQIQAWMRKLKRSLANEQKAHIYAHVQDFRTYKDELISKYYHLLPRNF